MGTLIQLIDKYQDKDWKWELLSDHPNITLDYVLTTPHLPWDWELLSENPNITIEHVLEYPDKDWN